MFSMKTKLILLYTLVFCVFIIGYSVIIYEKMEQAAIETLDARIVVFAEGFESDLLERMEEKSNITIEDILHAKFEGSTSFAVRLFNSSGILVYADSIFSSGRIGTVPPPDRQYFGFAKLQSHRFRIATIPLREHRTLRFLLQVAVPMSEVDASLSYLRWIFLVTIPFAVVLAALVGYVITRIGFKPLTGMIDAAKRITEKNLTERLPLPNTNDEVKTLGVTFNMLIERITSALKMQKQFIADASHEIRTPLTIISSELEFARRRSPDPEIQESIAISMDEVDHLKHLTEDLLLLARLDSHQVVLHRKQFRIDELVLDCIRRVKNVAAENNNTFQMTIESGIEIDGDEEKLGSVIRILIDNAIKYGRNGSVINVQLALDSNANIRLRIINNGEGIPAAELPNIFNRFYRGNATRTEKSGSGLGLAIALKIVELHNGTIHAHSVPQDQTIFTVELPILPAVTP
jgi:signal transduction histidine kinase